MMIICSKSPLEEVFVRETTLNTEQRTEMISWVNSYVDTVKPDFMMLLDMSKKSPVIYEMCFDTDGMCTESCSGETLRGSVVKEQHQSLQLVEEELLAFSVVNSIPPRACSFNLRYNLGAPGEKPITFLRSVIAVSNDAFGKPAILLVLLQDITKMTNAVQGTYFEIKCLRSSGIVNEQFKSLERRINGKINAEIILTKRESQVLQLLIKGYSSVAISKEFFIAKNTVDKHRQNLMRKYKVNNVTQLIRKYLQSVS
ncbi:MAG: response regulator transcription factor [Flavobacteriaceae bacterium]|nr:response regulator transcription factor [Flavobacteriaceae bacterium]